MAQTETELKINIPDPIPYNPVSDYFAMRKHELWLMEEMRRRKLSGMTSPRLETELEQLRKHRELLRKDFDRDNLTRVVSGYKKIPEYKKIEELREQVEVYLNHPDIQNSLQDALQPLKPEQWRELKRSFDKVRKIALYPDSLTDGDPIRQLMSQEGDPVGALRFYEQFASKLARLGHLTDAGNNGMSSRNMGIKERVDTSLSNIAWKIGYFSEKKGHILLGILSTVAWEIGCLSNNGKTRIIERDEGVKENNFASAVLELAAFGPEKADLSQKPSAVEAEEKVKPLEVTTSPASTKQEGPKRSERQVKNAALALKKRWHHHRPVREEMKKKHRGRSTQTSSVTPTFTPISSPTSTEIPTSTATSTATNIPTETVFPEEEIRNTLVDLSEKLRTSLGKPDRRPLLEIKNWLRGLSQAGVIIPYRYCHLNDLIDVPDHVIDVPVNNAYQIGPYLNDLDNWITDLVQSLIEGQLDLLSKVKRQPAAAAQGDQGERDDGRDSQDRDGTRLKQPSRARGRNRLTGFLGGVLQLTSRAMKGGVTKKTMISLIPLALAGAGIAYASNRWDSNLIFQGNRGRTEGQAPGSSEDLPTAEQQREARLISCYDQISPEKIQPEGPDKRSLERKQQQLYQAIGLTRSLNPDSVTDVYDLAQDLLTKAAVNSMEEGKHDRSPIPNNDSTKIVAEYIIEYNFKPPEEGGSGLDQTRLLHHFKGFRGYYVFDESQQKEVVARDVENDAPFLLESWLVPPSKPQEMVKLLNCVKDATRQAQ